MIFITKNHYLGGKNSGRFDPQLREAARLPSSVADDTTNNEKDKDLQNINLLHCDSLDCKRTFL